MSNEKDKQVAHEVLMSGQSRYIDPTLEEKIVAALTTIRQEERRAAFRDAAVICREQESPEYDIEVMASGWEDCKLHCADTLEAAANESVTNEATLLEPDNNLLWINPVAGAVAHYKAGAAFLPYRLVREDGDDA